MDIRNWSINQIMQLPDHCFGQRWPIAEGVRVEDTTRAYAICSTGLPERCVIWGLWLQTRSSGWSPAEAELRLGDKLPADITEFRAMEPLFPTVRLQIVYPSVFIGAALGTSAFVPCRVYLKAQGRRVVFGLKQDVTRTTFIQVGLIISSVPTEVPDWLVSR